MRSCGRFVRRGIPLAMVLAAALPARADWPQFLGPDRNGIGPDGQGLARSWPAGGPKVLWSRPLGPGFAGPSIHGDAVFILDRRGDQEDVLRRFSLKTGEQVWESPYPAPGSLDYNGSRTTPATDGTSVFTIGPFGQIRAFRFDNGKQIWDGHILEDWGGSRPNWGVAQSPLLLGDAVIVAPWGKEAALVAYDKKTSKVLWRTPNPQNIGMDYSSPVLMQSGGKTVVVAAGFNGATIGADARTGQQIWSFTGYKCDIHIPSPVILDDGFIMLAGGYQAGAAIFATRPAAGRAALQTLWADRNVGSRIAQPLFHDGFIYVTSGDRTGQLKCFAFGGRTGKDSEAKASEAEAAPTEEEEPAAGADRQRPRKKPAAKPREPRRSAAARKKAAAGEVKPELRWEAGRAGAFGMGGIILVDGLIYAVQGDTGHLAMIEASPAAFKELGRAKVLDGPQIWAPLAYSDGRLVLRDQKKLICVDVKTTGH